MPIWLVIGLESILPMWKLYGPLLPSMWLYFLLLIGLYNFVQIDITSYWKQSVIIRDTAFLSLQEKAHLFRYFFV